MFEAKPPRPGDAQPLPTESQESHALRELTWADLVARLSASRNLRGEYEPLGGKSEASFDATSARRIAAHHHGELSVNLDASSYGKEGRGTAEPAVNGRGTGLGSDAARK